MSEPLYLVCHATRQIVHVAESNSSRIRGPDCGLLVGVFCETHSGQTLLALGAAEVDTVNDRAEDHYDEWTIENFDELMRALLGLNVATEQRILVVKKCLAELHA